MPNSAIDSLATALVDAAPWLQPYAELARHIVMDARETDLLAALNHARPDALRDFEFVPHAALPADEAYEAFIGRTHRIPTRDNLHDVLNALVWLHFPQTKRRLNELHANAIATEGIGPRRGPLRDALTLFDENAGVLCAPQALIDALARRDWHSVGVTGRDQWHEARLNIFGHALLEKLLVPRKAITAHIWVVEESSDAAIAATLSSSRLLTQRFLALPVLGVPGWCSQNTDPIFYADVSVFRPAR